MRTNPFREKLNLGKPMIGTHINLTDHRICEIMGSLGFDYLWIDMEHLSTSLKDMETHLIAAKAAGTPTLVRICWNDIPHTKRVIEAGPDAVVFPMINSVEEAKRAIDTCIYPPYGRRGFGPFRAVNYGIDDACEYINKGSIDMVRFLQVESDQAVDCMEEVAKIPYMDGFIVGPMDLSGSIGLLGELHNPKVDYLIDKAVDKAHTAGKFIGLSIGSDDPKELEHFISKGFDLISASTDVLGVIREGQRLLSDMKSIWAKYSK